MDKLFELENKKVEAQMAYNMFVEFYYYGPEMMRWATGFNKLANSKEFEKEAKKKLNPKDMFKDGPSFRASCRIAHFRARIREVETQP